MRREGVARRLGEDRNENIWPALECIWLQYNNAASPVSHS